MGKKSNKKKTTRKIHIGKFILISLLILILIVSAGAIGVTIAVVKSSPEISSNILNNLKQSSKIYDMNGKYIEDYSDTEIRSIVPINEIPKLLQDSFTSIEDERFRQHHGIDFKRIIGAIWVDIKTRSSAQGASTITQQLVKNVYLTNAKKVTRKIQEAYLALQLERKLSKDQILEAYLNTIYLGGSNYGVEATAENYFGKNINKLTLSQCAFLAGLNKNPLKYWPYSQKNNISVEWGPKYIESKDGEVKKIDSNINLSDQLPPGSQAKENINYTNQGEIPIDPKTMKPIDDKYSLLYYRRNVVLKKMYELKKITTQEYEDAKSEKLVFNSKKTAASMKYQWFIEPAINQIANDFKSKYGITINEAKQRLRIGGYNIYLTIDTKIQAAAEDVIGNSSQKPKQTQKAAVIYDYTSGQMRAIVGGQGKHPRLSANRATDIPRQPGSSLKPLSIYGPSIDSKLATAGTIIMDSPMSKEFVTSHNGWNPHNYETKRFSGRVTIREAIKKSINIVAIKLGDMLGTNTSIDYLQNKFHLSTIVTTGPTNDNGLSPLALGALTQGVYPYEMAAAYGVFGNNGMYTSPIMYTKLTDNTGNDILDNTTNQSQSISPQAAYIMVNMMKGVVSGGTGTRANIGKMPAAGKTGTAADNTNLWFCGLTPYYSGAVWIGNDKPNVSVKGLSSGAAASIWGKIMKVANKNLPIKDFARPAGLVTAQVCIDSGKSPTDYCSQDPRGSRVRSEIFIDGTQPVELCDFHKAPQIVPPPVNTTDSGIGVPSTNTGSGTNTNIDTGANTNTTTNTDNGVPPGQ